MRIVGPDANAQEIPALLPNIVPYWIPRGVRTATHWASGKLMPKIMAGSGIKTGAVPFPYAIDNLLIEYVEDDPGIPVGFWRSVGYFNFIGVIILSQSINDPTSNVEQSETTRIADPKFE